MLDVAVIGLGPVGQALAALLAARGVRVAAFDAADGPYGGPRAGALDDEALRVLQGTGVRLDGLMRSPSVHLRGVDGRLRRVFSPSAEPYGHPPLAFFHQPDLEAELLERVPDARWGAALTDLRQGADGVTAVVGGAEVRARWLVGCDGARSTVRSLLGIAFGGSTFAQPWLVVDAEASGVLDTVRMEFHGDPRRPAVTLPLSPRHHRWEWMLRPGEDPDALAAAMAERLPPGARVTRAVPYTYHARTAARWREGRVLLAGDAAHVMPPFAGQGLSGGLRDAANLAWKLAAVARGEAVEALLATYEPERRPSIVAHTRLAVAWGRAVQLRRRRLARARDAAIDAAIRVPWLSDWARGGGVRPAPRLRAGALGPGGGRYLPQPLVDGLPLDERLGPGWAAVATRDAPPGEDAWPWPAERVVVPSLERWARGRTLIVRPDRFVFAVAGPGAVRAWDCFAA